MENTGRYRIIRRLGVGSFATVWLGHDDELDVPVAVKVLADNWAANDDVRRRFLSEARILRKIRSQRVVQVYDIGMLDDDRPFFVMDYADAGTLNDLRRQRVAPKRALELCAQAAWAVQALHDNNVIHRDLTPANLLLTGKNQGQPTVLLADLGVAKSMDSVGITMTAGTPAFMAPEQARAEPFDHRADIYSLGAVTHALLTGEPPFPVSSLTDVITTVPTMALEPIAASVGAPPQLDFLMMSALSPRPECRPQSATQYAEALEAISQSMSEDTPPHPTASRAAWTPPATPSSHPPVSPQSLPNLALANFNSGPSATSWPPPTPPGYRTPQRPVSAPPGTVLPTSRDTTKDHQWLWALIITCALASAILLSLIVWG